MRFSLQIAATSQPSQKVNGSMNSLFDAADKLLGYRSL